MASEKSAGAVIFRKEEGEIHYLLLHYAGSKPNAKGYWDFAKGHLEEGETEMVAACREIEEETGLKDLRFIPGFRDSIKYFFRAQGKTIFKTVVFFLAEAEQEEIKISDEHIGYEWLPFDQAFKEMKFANAKKILTKANNHLINDPANHFSF
ncbi:MAG: bis(5'-nucleosyl)-tetraphosphatase [Candidatus Paceibacterota bacterium]|jgi:8-oxo-dGTP pyrophosphatase MutT (NUDIX family)